MLRAILAAVLSFVLPIGHATQQFLVPGALSTGCRSALRVGVVACSEPLGHNDKEWSISEAQVDEYLAQYGKPPREAVRALLDPSDANIAAWIKKQRQVVLTASYVAKRMTEMQSQSKADFPLDRLTPLSEISGMMQMRATLYLRSTDASSLRAAHALQQVVARYPSIDGQIVQLGPPSDGHPSDWLAKLDTLLPVSILAFQPIDDSPLPSLLIEDVRHGSSLRLDIADVTPRRIRDQIIALRAAAETRVRPSTPAASAP